MNILPHEHGRVDDFRLRATHLIAFASLILLGPFAINNLLNTRWVIGTASMLVIAVLLLTTWCVARSHPWSRPVTLLLSTLVLSFIALSIWRQGMIGVFWSYPAMLAFCAMLPVPMATVFCLLLLGVVSALAPPVAGAELWPRVLASLLGVGVFAQLFVRVIEHQQEALRKMAQTDPLTRLLNRNTLRDCLAAAVARAAADDRAVSLLSIDIDHFKSINDGHGHAVGDDVLRGVAECLHTHTRMGEYGFRLGGEEFLLVLDGCDQVIAKARAEQIRRCVAGRELLPGHAVTVSLGVAEWRPGESIARWLSRSDQCLYQAKHSGRDRVAA
ncbi:MAG TPA: GGDEF domain-containing protein [Arenimonas sp.]|nr:GGDEF domain-containing protein [Arenimonas sp.]